MIKNNVFDEEILPMTRKIRSADNDAKFDGYQAAGVNVSPEKKRGQNLSVKTLAGQDHNVKKSWE